MPSQWLEDLELVRVGKVQKEVLRQRLEDLGWTTYKLAQEVAQIRRTLYQEDVRNHRSLISSLDRALDNPESATGKTLESIILALGGKLQIQWTNERIVIETKDVDLSSSQETTDSQGNKPED